MDRGKKRITSWHLIGAQLGTLRMAAGMTQPELAEALLISMDKLASIEQGRRVLTLALAREIDQLLDSKGVLETAVRKMPKREKFPLFAQDFMEYEQRALAIEWYENQVIPGLLQTPEYARAVFECLQPALEEDEIDEKVADRMERKEVLDRTGPRVEFSNIIEESVLRRNIGGKECMRNQLRHLCEMAQLPHVTVQIMPMEQERHASLDGPFIMLETDEYENVAYVEGQRVSFMIDDPDEVSIFRRKYGMLRSQALTPEESLSLMNRMLGER
ncbi:helix-turn-helix domain-containing protein [Streptomyces sp. NPDC087440]|uniref:helix-turn-helix domain-containing protein n=1 Tax=Streptomyces sp. NPDC087440 TaxID=3365790 RepID=UPI003808AAE3